MCLVQDRMELTNMVLVLFHVEIDIVEESGGDGSVESQGSREAVSTIKPEHSSENTDDGHLYDSKGT